MKVCKQLLWVAFFLAITFQVNARQKEALRLNINLGYQTEWRVGTIGVGFEVPVIKKRLYIAPSYTALIKVPESELNFDLRGYVIRGNIEWYMFMGMGISIDHERDGLDDYSHDTSGVNFGTGFNIKLSSKLRLNTQGKMFFSFVNPYFLIQSGISVLIFK